MTADARARFPEAAPLAFSLTQQEIDDLESQARFDGVLIGAALGIAVGTPVAFVLFRWLA